MNHVELCGRLGKQAAEYQRSFILPPKRISSQKKTVKVEHGKPVKTPETSGMAAVQPAQRYGVKLDKDK